MPPYKRRCWPLEMRHRTLGIAKKLYASSESTLNDIAPLEFLKHQARRFEQEAQALSLPALQNGPFGADEMSHKGTA